VLTLVHGSAPTGRALAAADIDGLLFTGSAGAGAALARQFAESPGKILALEMGGNNPLVVWNLAEADIEAAAALVVQSAYLSAGQRCTNARRLIVQDGQHRPLVAAVTALIDRLIVDHPFADPQPFLGPVIHNGAADALMHAASAMEAGGAVPIRALTRPVADRPFLTPGLYDVTALAQRSDDELFGPLLQIIRVPDFDAAMIEANATRFGLAAGLIGGDAALYERFWAASRAGVVNWNRPTNGAASSAPFGGIGASGNHRPSAYYAADYAAWPVASLEADAISATITTGVR
jgi:succinylglutamic semialdehyde dehydrogenase